MLGGFFQKRSQHSNASIKDNQLYFDNDAKHGKFATTKNSTNKNNEYSQRLNLTAFNNKNEVGNISTPLSNNMVNAENHYYHRNNNYHNNTPIILEHMSDELKIKLLGSRNVPMANTVDDLLKNSTMQDNSLSKYTFRVIVAEETGQMACRNNYKVALDFSHPKDSTIEKIRFNELKQYMFGSMIRSNDSFQPTDKFRPIPNSNFILITRIFYYETAHNRIAISICISKKLFSIVTELWDVVDAWFNEVQHSLMSFIKLNFDNFIMENLTLADQNNKNDCTINNNNSSLLTIEPNSNFRKNMDRIIHLLQKNVISNFKNMSEIPRLFIYPADDTRFVETWFKDVFNWLEIKDGPKLNFLPTLIAAVLLDVKNYMEDTPTSRLVVMSGNMVVANKLLFIVTNIMKPRFNASIDEFIGQSSMSQGSQEMTDLTNTLFNKTTISTNSDTLDAQLCDRTMINDGSPNSKFSNSSCGWEMPKKANSNISVSLSSDDSNGQVIQPSSIKSGGSSFKYLSSSLSSQPGSYGSWFSKRPSLSQFISQSPSIKNDDTWERISAFQYHNTNGGTSTVNGTLHKTASTSSLHQLFNRIPNPNQTPQPSPSISEYDEYPWLGTPESPRVDGYYYSAINNNNSIKLPQNMSLRDIDITRDCQKISQSDIIDKAFEQICKSSFNELSIQHEDNGYHITGKTESHAAVLELDLSQTDLQKTVDETLPFYTSYLTHFNNIFQVQGIPITPDSEQQVISAMKKDLQNEFYACTTIVSLRTREIKQIMMKKDLDKNSSTKSFKQKIKKIFCNGKYGNLSIEMEDCINFVNARLKEANALCEDLELQDDIRAIRLTQIFLSIINYAT